MLTDIELLSVVVAACSGLYLLGAFAWSIMFPKRRVWPPKAATRGIKLRVWIATIAIFGAAFVLGVVNWNDFGWPAPLRWGLGVPMILAGNVIVWMGVRKIGLGATSGEVAVLKTDGLYQYSRNPQYVADMVILMGWAVLSASGWAVAIAGLGITTLAAAPHAEEPWLDANYGDQFRDYKRQVRRYF